MDSEAVRSAKVRRRSGRASTAGVMGTVHARESESIW
jgi:hypothetical protein